MDDSRNGLSACRIAASTSHVWKAFTYLDQVWLTVRRRDTGGRNVVRWMVNELIAKHWTQDDEENEACKRFQILHQDNSLVEKRWLPELTSR